MAAAAVSARAIAGQSFLYEQLIRQHEADHVFAALCGDDEIVW